MLKFSTLDLGNPTDAKSWEAGCRSLGMQAEDSVMTSSPGTARLKDFFFGQPDWVYFSGHFAGGDLWGDGGDTVSFASGHVVISSGGTETKLLPDQGFAMYKYCSLVIWGGCSACSSPSTIRNIRELFANPTILGYAGSTGWKINDAMLGGGFIRPHFFANLRASGPGPYNSATLVNAWMDAAKWGYGGSAMESLFRAIDADGRESRLSNGQVVSGRTL